MGQTRTKAATFAMVVSLVSIMSGGEAASGTAADGTPEVGASCWTWTETEHDFARRTNEERTSRGLEALRLDPELSKVAGHHAHEMAERGEIYHTPEDVYGRRVTNWRILGENVGQGDSVSDTHRAFMSSASHRDNILYPRFNYLGVGSVREGGYIWVTVAFEAYDNPGTTMRMPC